MKKAMKAVYAVAIVLLVVGGLNWGLIGFSYKWNVFDILFGAGSLVSSVVYLLIGISALFVIFGKLFKKKRK